MHDDLDDILDDGVQAVIAATILAVGLTVVERFSHTEGGNVDALAKSAWIVWAFVVTAWLAVVFLDYFVPVKADPVILDREDLDDRDNLVLDQHPGQPLTD